MTTKSVSETAVLRPSGTSPLRLDRTPMVIQPEVRLEVRVPLSFKEDDDSFVLPLVLSESYVEALARTLGYDLIPHGEDSAPPWRGWQEAVERSRREPAASDGSSPTNPPPLAPDAPGTTDGPSGELPEGGPGAETPPLLAHDSDWAEQFWALLRALSEQDFAEVARRAQTLDELTEED